jgi:hypothetical protein
MTKPKFSLLVFIGWALLQILPDIPAVRLMFWMRRHRKYFMRVGS